MDAKKKKHKGVFGLDGLWQAAIAVVVFGVVLVIGSRIMIGMNTTYPYGLGGNGTGTPTDDCFGKNQSGACTTVLNNSILALVNLSSWTSLITTVVAGIIILALIMGVAYMGRGGGTE